MFNIHTTTNQHVRQQYKTITTLKEKRQRRKPVKRLLIIMLTKRKANQLLKQTPNY
jgi:hypothetical protein